VDVRTLLRRNSNELKLKGLEFVRENQRNAMKLKRTQFNLMLLKGKGRSDLVCNV